MLVFSINGQLNLCISRISGSGKIVISRKLHIDRKQFRYKRRKWLEKTNEVYNQEKRMSSSSDDHTYL